MSLRFYSSFLVLLVLTSGSARARQNFVEEAKHPFDNLPDLGIAPENREGEKQFAEMVKSFGEASMTITAWTPANRRDFLRSRRCRRS